jgi:hypothetical protein
MEGNIGPECTVGIYFSVVGFYAFPSLMGRGAGRINKAKHTHTSRGKTRLYIPKFQPGCLPSSQALMVWFHPKAANVKAHLPGIVYLWFYL